MYYNLSKRNTFVKSFSRMSSVFSSEFVIPSRAPEGENDDLAGQN